MERRNEEIQLNNVAGVHVQGEEGVAGSTCSGGRGGYREFFS